MPKPRSLQWEIDRIPNNRKVIHAGGLRAYAVDGIVPKVAAFPNTIEEIRALLFAASKEGKSVIPWGGGTAMSLGNRPRYVDLVIGTSRLNRILEHEPADLTVVVQAGATLGGLQDVLCEKDQFLPLDPPFSDDATIGGILAANSSGPIRAQFGTARDILIGIKVVHANGDVTKGGGKVVKNVSGYDMNKLYTGSLGTLGIIIEAAFKVAPLFKERRTLIIPCNSVAEASHLSVGIQKSGTRPLALQLLVGGILDVVPKPTGFVCSDIYYLLALEIGSTPSALLQQVNSLYQLRSKDVFELGDQESKAFWSVVRNVGRSSNQQADMILKLTCLPNDIAKLIDGISLLPRSDQTGLGISCNMVNGIIYAYWWDRNVCIKQMESRVHALRNLTKGLKGHCVVETCPEDLKSLIDVWGLEGPQIDLMKRIKQQFDPGDILNPGRFVEGI